MKKRYSLIGISIILFFTLYLFRYRIMLSMSEFLIKEDALKPLTYMAVLSGGGWDRGNEAAALFQKKYCQKIICTGGNEVYDLKAWGLDVTESDVSIKNLKRNLVPDSCIIQIEEGTSTAEERNLLLQYCKKNNIQQLMILSSKYHLRRCRMVFDKPFQENGIELVYRGSNSSRFDVYKWWESEDGMIALNNEYMKFAYYLFFK